MFQTINTTSKSRGKRLRQFSASDVVLDKRKHSEISEEVTSDDSDFVYPRLYLTRKYLFNNLNCYYIMFKGEI